MHRPLIVAQDSQKCHSCQQWLSGTQGICPKCEQVRTCAVCANNSHVQAQHNRICFSITAPTSIVETAVSRAVGGLGAVHQFITMRAFLAGGHEMATRIDAWARKTPRMDVRVLVAGVIYNDFPGPDELDADQTYIAQTLVPINPQDAIYLTDARFAVQPSKNVRWASAAVYKGIPAFVMSAFGIQGITMQKATDMLQRRTKEDVVNYHFLRASNHELPAETIERTLTTAKRWYRLAVQWKTFFVLGHILHTIEDSFSPAHTRRALGRTERHPYGTVEEIFFFGNQTDRSHSSHESWESIQSPGGVGARCVDVAVMAVSSAIRRFLDDIDGAPMLPLEWDASRMDAEPPGQCAYAQERANVFAEWLRAQVFAYHTSLL